MDSAMPRSAQARNIGRRRGERAVPGFDIVLLRADVKRHAVRHEPELVRMFENVGGVDRLAAELA